jgi:hypothetical protein
MALGSQAEGVPDCEIPGLSTAHTGKSPLCEEASRLVSRPTRNWAGYLQSETRQEIGQGREPCKEFAQTVRVKAEAVESRERVATD